MHYYNLYSIQFSYLNTSSLKNLNQAIRVTYILILILISYLFTIREIIITKSQVSSEVIKYVVQVPPTHTNEEF